MNGKVVIAKLKAAGWSINRIHGSHHIMTKGGQAVPVPVHGSRDIACWSDCCAATPNWRQAEMKGKSVDIRYPATVEKQKDGSFLVQFVDLPDTFTEGPSKEEAQLQAGAR